MGRLIIPDDFSELQQLKAEADFYQIGELTEAVEYEIVRRDSLKPAPEVPSQRDYYLDVMEFTAISGGVPGTCERIMVLCGHVDVIKCLPIDSQIYGSVSYLCTNRGGTHRNDPSFENRDKLKCVSSGDSAQLFITTFYTQDGPNMFSPSYALHMNRSDLADVLLAKNCTLVTSSSEFNKTHKGISEFQCSDKWKIPQESLQHLSNLPKI